MDDEGDFKKARGFLLTYSALVLALWYFGADLTQFKLMGNEIKLHQRVESVWLVLAGLNVYFWFRFYQHIPRNGLYFDERMNDIYDEALAWTATKLKRAALKRRVAEEFAARHSDEKIKLIRYHGQAVARSVLEDEASIQGEDVPGLHQVTRKFRTTVHLSATFTHTIKLNLVPFSLPVNYGNYEPSAAVTYPVKAFAVIRGAFVTPWFTDHIAPLVLGGISTGFALWKWCDMNFFITSLPQLAQTCAGVNH
ncbi:hypothetical protein [Pseudomonas shahriarae]|uniref:hypothetical protein n=1 Tax=Pseudomonas shahriarae TaxID=2745512 RepID=UPI00235E059E|nr:hypothetical protein [Pseudomonas shahriarae]MDD0982885.1 hypothetical protein [Pseudomonas shahriarae]